MNTSGRSGRSSSDDRLVQHPGAPLDAAAESSSLPGAAPDGDAFGSPADGPERGGAGAALAVLVLLVIVLGAGYVWAAVNAGDRLPPGTLVSGVEVGGLQPAAAEVTLRNGLASRVEDDVELLVAGEQVVRSPAALGLKVDYAASIDQASDGATWLPANLWRFYTAGERYEAVVDVDRSVLAPALGDLVAGAEKAPVEGQVIISGTGYEVVEPVVGSTLDRAAASGALRREWLGSGPVELPLQPAVPEIDTQDVDAAVEAIAEPAVSGPVRLSAGGGSVELAPRDFTDLLSLTPVDGALELAVNQERLPLRVSLALRREGLLKPGRDAAFDITDGRPSVVPAAAGEEVDAEELVRRFREAVVADGRDRAVQVPVVKSTPELTTAAAEQLQITEKLAEVRIPYAPAPFRDTNLAAAAEQLDGSLIGPGESLSFNDTVGPPTPERGFVEGPLVDDGQAFTGAGAGLSRLATALTSAAWQSALDLADRSPMPWHPEEYPIGVDAAVQYGSVDLVVANPSPYGVLITAQASTRRDRSVTVAIWSTRWRSVRTSLSAFTGQESPKSRFLSGEGCVAVAGQPGFDVTASRTLSRPRSGKPVGSDDLVTTYRPLPNIVCVAP